MLNLRPAHLLTALILLFAAPPSQLLAQPSPCLTGQALLATTDPIYADAMELSRTMEANGFTVRCVSPTKLRSMFEQAYGNLTRSTIAGEASFETNYGYVDVVFLPKSQTFADSKSSNATKAAATFTRLPVIRVFGTVGSGLVAGYIS